MEAIVHAWQTDGDRQTYNAIAPLTLKVGQKVSGMEAAFRSNSKWFF